MLTTRDFDAKSALRITVFLGTTCCILTALAQVAKPPVAPVRPVTDTYYGQQVVDPYRWLEDQKSDESKSWMRGQADYTRAVLDSIPARKQFASEMEKYLNAEDASITDVQLAGDSIFYRKRPRGSNQASLYVRKASGGPEKLLLDLPKLSTPQVHVSLDQYIPSEDGKLVAVGLSPGGSELQTGHFYETATGHELPEQLERFEGGGFSPDGRIFYYEQLEKLPPDAPAVDKYKHVKEFSHTIGTQQTADAVVLGQGVSPDIDVPDYVFAGAFPVPGSKYVLAFVNPGVEVYRSVYIGEISAMTTHKGWTKVADLKDKVADVALEGNDLYLVSFDGTLNGKILRLDAAHPSLASAQVIVPPSDLVMSGGFIGSDVLKQASDAIYLNVIQNGYGKVLRLPYGKEAKAVMLPLPVGQTVSSTITDLQVPGAVLRLNSWTAPGDFYRYDPTKKTATAMLLAPRNATDPTDLVSEEVQAKAPDGTLLPLSIIYKKGLVKDGTAPTALIGYGAYGDAFMPGFSRRNMAWLERGGVFAVAHVRGGGELGEGWHLAGKKLTKPNTWRDFIASAQYLIDNKYTTTARLGIWSQSAGGVLIGRSITERPDLFAAAVDGVPCSDMVRQETGPNGPGNIPEFGSVKTEDGFKGLYEMSSYYHVTPGTKYPATLVTAGANDPRVDPWQGGKLAARLEAANAGPHPILFRVNYDAGHGITDTVAQQVSDWTDIFTFFLWNFGDPAFQPTVAAPAVSSK
jgi:prolyl oligopeptidase